MTDLESWVIVPNWDTFQHYKDRDPLWIKVYTELNSRADWLQLSVAERGLLCTIWVEYARSHGILPTKTVQRLCAKSARSSHWTSLSDAGFIQLSASKPLALTRVREPADAPSRELEKRREENAHARANEEPARARSPEKKTGKHTDYHRAETFTRNAGWQYLEREYVDELARYQLSDDQRSKLEQLYATLNTPNGGEPPTNPELDW